MGSIPLDGEISGRMRPCKAKDEAKDDVPKRAERSVRVKNFPLIADMGAMVM